MMTMSTFLERVMPTVRLVTWNIDSRLDNRRERLDAIFETLKKMDADIICLQEVWEGADEELAKRLGFTVMTSYMHPDSVFPFKNTIISRLPLAPQSAEHYNLLGIGENDNSSSLVALSLISPSGRTWRINTSHLCWGGMGEGVRLSQVQQIEKLARQAQDQYPELVQVLTGDFNTLPDSATLRYITGLEPDKDGGSIIWVDAWGKLTSAPGYTSTPKNPLSASVAKAKGIMEPMFLPERRIDYILVRGYAHGKPGTPMSVKLLDRDVNGVQPSDHYGIVANLFDPAI